jgi:hypothetical protein
LWRGGGGAGAGAGAGGAGGGAGGKDQIAQASPTTTAMNPTPAHMHPPAQGIFMPQAPAQEIGTGPVVQQGQGMQGQGIWSQAHHLNPQGPPPLLQSHQQSWPNPQALQGIPTPQQGMPQV